MCVTRVLFIILAVVTGMGSISLGSYQVVSQNGGASDAYLVTNYAFVLIALGFGALGAFFVYLAGKASVLSDNPKKHVEKEAHIIAK